MVIFDQFRPKKHVWSVNPQSMALFLRFKYGESGAALKDMDGNSVLDVLGRPILSEKKKGLGWNNPKNANQFRCAIGAIHAGCGLTGDYVDFCEDCRNLPEDCIYRGCKNHPGHPQRKRQGNPTRDYVFVNELDRIVQDRRNYKENGAKQLLPSDMRLLHQGLTACEDVLSLQTYVMLLLGIKQFLRNEEEATLTNDSFVKELAIVSSAGVKALSMKVCGKADDEEKHFWVWSDDENPEFCPVRHLLIYLDLIGYKGGYIFPTHHEISFPPTDGIFTTSIGYSDVLEDLMFLFGHYLRSTQKLGTHTRHKTGYLFAVWGGADIVNLMNSAHHKCYLTARNYLQDASSQKTAKEAEGNDPTLAVSEWKPILCENIDNARSITASSRPYQRSLPELVYDFISTKIGIDNNHPKGRSIPFLVQSAMLWVPHSNDRENCEAYLKKILSQEQFKNVIVSMFLG